MNEDLDALSRAIASLRGDHADIGLDIDHLEPDPFIQFGQWLHEALELHKGWPNAMTLATADEQGIPSARMVLLKGVDHDGFTFFTNFESRKGRELAANPNAALVFYWPLQGRQVCVRGTVERVPEQESDGYFSTRPLGSRLATWVSKQSRPLDDRATLDRGLAEARERFGDDVPRPDHWGGFRLTPATFEFWKSRSNRLHDRFAYERAGDAWRIERLYP